MRTGSHFYIPHYKSCLPTEVLHNLCFSFLPGIALISIQIGNNAYAKLWGQTRCIIGDVLMAVISGYNLGQGAVVCGCFSSIRLLHISLSASYSPPKILHNLCFSFLLGIKAVPRELRNNASAYAKFWGAASSKRSCEFNKSKRHHWWRDADGFGKLWVTFHKLLVLKYI